MRMHWFAAAAVAVASVVITSTAEAQCVSAGGQVRCYGEDIGPGNGSLPTASRANSDGARNNFFGFLSGVGTEDFESFAAGTTPPLALMFAGAGTATLSNTGGSADQIINVAAGTANGAGRWATSGTRLYETRSSNGGSTFRISFDQEVAAFGFYGTDIGDFGSQLSLQFWRGGAIVDTWALPYGTAAGSIRESSLLYAGYINTSLFDEILFLGTDNSDVFGFDDMTVGSLQQVRVPEPGALALLALGLVGLMAVRQRRARA